MRFSKAFAVCAIATLLLSACSSRGIHKPEMPESATAVSYTPIEKNSSLEDEGTLTVKDEFTSDLALGGSGGCPPVIKSAFYESAGGKLTIVLDHEAYINVSCTMDYALQHWELKTESPIFAELEQVVVINSDFVSEVRIKD